MIKRQVVFGSSLILLSLFLLSILWRTSADEFSSIAFNAREDAYRANNLGVALMEQYKYKEAAAEFERAIKIDPQLAIAQINLAIALYNVPDMDGALRAAKKASEVAPNAPQPHYILGLIARSQNRPDDGIAEFQRVLQIDPQDVGANVQLGQLYAQERKYPEAIKVLRVAVSAEPYNTTAVYALAQALLRSGAREEGQAMLKKFQELRASGSGTSLGQNYLEQGRYAEAITSTGAEDELVDKRTPDVRFVDASSEVLPPAARAAKYTVGVINAPPSPPATWPGILDPIPNIAGAKIAAKFSGNVTLIDFDGDGALDVLEVEPMALHLYRNDNGRFVDVTAQSGLNQTLASNANAVNITAIAGDYDNDGKPDIFVLRYGVGGAPIGLLYHNEGNGRFTERTAQAKIPNFPFLAVSAAFVDVDHDGDLDIVIAGYADLSKSKPDESPLALPPAPNLLLRNNGDGTFTDISAEAKINEPRGHAIAVVPTDYDNRRDVDLLIAREDAPPLLFRNMRDHSFREVSHETGLDKIERASCVAAGDVNKDGYTDFFFGSREGAGVFAMSDGQMKFKIVSAPNEIENSTAAQFFDYDNDGLLDLVTISTSGLNVWRNLGNQWADVTRQTVSNELQQNLLPQIPYRAQGTAETALRQRREMDAQIISYLPRSFVSADLDGDGDTDILIEDAVSALHFVRNDGGNRNRSVRVRLTGRVSNKSGVEAKVEARAGSLWQKIETFAASPAPAPSDVLFGIGKRERVDAVRILWPSGVVQAETEIPTSEVAANERNANNSTAKNANNSTAKNGGNRIAKVPTLDVIELDRKPSSCPFLYAWNGERFEFITDFMGGGEMGDWVAPGVYSTPDSDEYVRIRGDQLKPKDGRYELRVTNELEEVLFIDKLQLVSVSHPKDVEVYPNEGLGNPLAGAFKLYMTKNAHPPVKATDEHGHDVLARIAKLDRVFVDDFTLKPIRGYAETHSLTLDLGADAKNAKRVLLLLTGWTDYAFSSDNVRASQMNLSLQPTSVQVKNKQGEWQTVVDSIGFAVGRPQTIMVDLTGKFLSDSREVRLVTNMRSYWDQILVDTSAGDFPFKIERLDAVAADLHPRGYSVAVSPDGREPFSYDYTKILADVGWKSFPGRYTRFGDVRELLKDVDDMFVVSRHGDEISLSFDADALAPLPEGWTRTFLLYADGFSKEMDPNSASPFEIAELPFHAMKNYPYSPPEHYPNDAKHLEYIEHYNTRIVASPLPTLAGRMDGGASEEKR